MMSNLKRQLLPFYILMKLPYKKFYFQCATAHVILNSYVFQNYALIHGVNSFRVR